MSWELDSPLEADVFAVWLTDPKRERERVKSLEPERLWEDGQVGRPVFKAVLWGFTACCSWNGET